MPDLPDVYRRLQQHVDRMPVAFPATASGVELRILSRLFTRDEAEVALSLSAVPETLDRIHRRDRRSGRTRDELERLLDRLAEKGAILGGKLAAKRGGTTRYSKAMLVLGIYELQVDRLTKELEQDVQQYMQEAFGKALLTGKTTQMRTVPVNARFVAERQVGRYDDARRLVEHSSGPWALLNCVCRQGKDLLGEPCRQTAARRTCLTLKGIARAAVASGIAEEVSRQDALALVCRAESDGMVLQPANMQDPLFICFCCGCCCGLLRTAKRFPQPAEYLHSNYRAAVDPELCSECQTCHARCPMEALASGRQGATVVDLGRCIGCGACVGACPTGAVRLVAKGKPTIPPRNREALYLKILKERFGLLASARMVGRAFLGQKV
jgi:Pyruvate/2-oxoacid:ferredoxin oxidoreductase delta subunit